MFDIKEVVIEEERQFLIDFLKKYGLDYEYDIDYSIIVYDRSKPIGTASIANNVLKCFLVIPDYQNKNITTVMFNHLVNVLSQKGIHHYFVYTKPSNEKVFTSLSMKKIVETMNTVLLEGGDDIFSVLTTLKNTYHISDKKKACVIVNANPMTLGHLHLIETASKENEELLVFVVSEDLSKFPFVNRFEIIQKATAHLQNVTVLPTLSYLVSKITFPRYFLKEDQLIKDEQTLVDVLVYKQYYTQIFNIDKRYVGEEPFSFTTAKYNKVLKDHLHQHLIIIPRKEKDGKAISASLVRQLIKSGKLEKLKNYVPQATYDFLQSEDGKKVIEQIQKNPLSRH